MIQIRKVDRKFIACLILVFILNIPAHAQGDLFGEEDYLSTYEESDLYITGDKRNQYHRDDAYTGWGSINATVPQGQKSSSSTPSGSFASDHPSLKENGKPANASPARGVDCVPSVPGTDPDVPINNEIAYLMILGLLFGGYKLLKIKRYSITKNGVSNRYYFLCGRQTQRN